MQPPLDIAWHALVAAASTPQNGALSFNEWLGLITLVLAVVLALLGGVNKLRKDTTDGVTALREDIGEMFAEVHRDLTGLREELVRHESTRERVVALEGRVASQEDRIHRLEVDFAERLAQLRIDLTRRIKEAP